MTCSQIQKLLNAHHDGELDAAHALEVDEHLADCPRCFGVTRNLRTLSDSLQNEALRFSAPAGLLRSAIMQAGQAAQAETDTTTDTRRFRHWTWAAAAILLASAILFFQLRLFRTDDHLLAEITANHIRSLMVDHVTDIASTDQHTVKPWFDGKLDFAPPVTDLKSAGFPLLGGRLDYLTGRAVAALVYARQKHTINLFIWPAESTDLRSPHTAQRSGYNIVQWSTGRMNLVAISDLNERELKEFAGLVPK